MFSDLRYALRSLLKAPGFSSVCVLILALGIGAITAVFSAVESVLLRPLPFDHPGELYTIQSAAYNEVGLFSVPEFCVYRDQTRAFQGLVAASTYYTNLVDHGEAQLAQGIRISANAFQVLGVHPLVGRLLTPEDDKPNAPRVAVIGEAFWRRVFGASREVVGRTVQVNGQPCTLVGVVPNGFILPMPAFRDDILVPLQADADPLRFRQGSLHFLRVVGRLAPGVTPTQALSDLASILRDLRQRYPKENGGTSPNLLFPMADQIVGDSRPMLLTLFGLVGALLLLASTNLAGLHLVRAIGRQHDFALRTALGASRSRLIRLVIAECLVLTAAGAVAGLLFAGWALKSLQAFVPADLPRGGELQFNPAVFAFAILVSLFFGLAPALSPIWLLARNQLRDALAAGGRRAIAGHRGVRHILASIQVALALALLVCCALFLRSFWAAGKQRLGFDTSNTLTVRQSLAEAGYNTIDLQIHHLDRMQERLRAIPGIESVGASGLLPLLPGLATIDFNVTGQPPTRASETPLANYRLVTPGYFDAMRIPLLQGRVLNERDDKDHPLSVVVSASLADSLFPNHDAIGHQLDLQDTTTGARTAQIVGIISNVKMNKVEDAPSYDIYVSYRQMDPTAVTWNRYRTYWILRGNLGQGALETAVRQAIHAEDPSIALSSFRTLEQINESALAGRMFTLIIVGFFAATALLLTVAGIYSVIAFGVAQRTREIGVRLALGADTGQIFTLILRDGLAIIAYGIPLGIAAALVLSHLIATQLYGVGPTDPMALGAGVVLLAAIGFLGSWIPARRAAQISPMVALQAE